MYVPTYVCVCCRYSMYLSRLYLYTYIRIYTYVSTCVYCRTVCVLYMYEYISHVCAYVCTYIQYNSLYPSLHTVCLSSTLNLFLFALSPLPSPPGFNDMELLREMFASSRTARCRSRFVVPVILLNDHTHICRSATLSTYAELCGRQGYDWLSSELISSMFIFCPANHSM